MIALVDADNVAFACAASAESEEEEFAIARAQEMVFNILRSIGADSAELWLTGKNNFRSKVYPEYKMNRKDAYRPKHEKAVKEHFRKVWDANTSDGCEADDMLGCRLTELKDNAILCHLDKDMNQISGWHFNWELRRLGKTIRPETRYYVSPEEADRFFYYQLIVGDTTDNIKGVSGYGPKKAELLLEHTPRSEWLSEIRDLYSSKEELDMNAQCVYIHRKPNDHWTNLLTPNENQYWSNLND
jgi:5'-3' exonuclease